jgi:predicted transposase YbfD/YdcC
MTMQEKPQNKIAEHFGSVQDPRIERSKEHKLIDIISIGICAVICGAEGWVDIENFGKSKETWLKTFLELPNGIPSHDTFGRVFSLIEPEEFQESFQGWIESIQELTKGEIIAIDGKQIRGSKDGFLGKRAIYMVSAWAEANELVLGQRKVNEKSNEITAIPELLKILDISGCIITIDAIGTQTKIAKAIIDSGADYLLSVKENQGHLFEEISWLFEYDQQHNFKDAAYDHVKTTNKGHGRIEIRECWSISDPEYLQSLKGASKWKGLRSIAMVTSTRITDKRTTVRNRYYISSLPSKAKHLLNVARRHWSIENELHWVLDVALREDRSRIRKENAPENFSVLRHLAISLLKQEKTAKGGIHAKQLQAAWNEDYLLKVLSP